MSTSTRPEPSEAGDPVLPGRAGPLAGAVLPDGAVLPAGAVLPDDPMLPGLAAVAALPADAGSVRVLAHRPGRRATVRLCTAGSTRIVKVFSAKEFGAALEVNRAGARHDGLAPALLAVDEAGCLLELEAVAGHDLNAVHPARLGTALRGLGPVLAGVHAVSPVGLEPWDLTRAGAKLRRFLTAAAVAEPTHAALLTDLLAPVLTVLLPRVERPVDRPACLHGDLSLRNVMLEPAGGLRLIDWDRAAAGPPEADLAPLVGLLGQAADRVVDGYRAAGGRVDDGLLADLVLVNRVTRALRRLAAGRESVEAASVRLERLVEQVREG